MEKDTKVDTYKGMSPDTGIFYKRGYGKEYCSTLPIRYPLSSLPQT